MLNASTSPRSIAVTRGASAVPVPSAGLNAVAAVPAAAAASAVAPVAAETVVEPVATKAAPRKRAAKADAIFAAREAALADAEGKSLDKALGKHGVTPRPPAEHPIKFIKTRLNP